MSVLCMRAISFDINGQNNVTLIRGQNDLIYFNVKYLTVPEIFNLKSGSVPVVKYLKTDDTIASVNGVIQSYFPACFYIILSADDTKLIKLGMSQKIQIEVQDAASNNYIGSKDAAWNITDPWLPGG